MKSRSQTGCNWLCLRLAFDSSCRAYQLGYVLLPPGALQLGLYGSVSGQNDLRHLLYLKPILIQVTAPQIPASFKQVQGNALFKWKTQKRPLLSLSVRCQWIGCLRKWILGSTSKCFNFGVETHIRMSLILCFQCKILRNWAAISNSGAVHCVFLWTNNRCLGWLEAISLQPRILQSPRCVKS